MPKRLEGFMKDFMMWSLVLTCININFYIS